jgi:hypothetical protein
MNATAKDLRFHSKELLDTVTRGEEVVITYRGKPCAEKNELFGIWKDHEATQDVDGYVRKLRKGRF